MLPCTKNGCLGLALHKWLEDFIGFLWHINIKRSEIPYKLLVTMRNDENNNHFTQKEWECKLGLRGFSRCLLSNKLFKFLNNSQNCHGNSCQLFSSTFAVYIQREIKRLKLIQWYSESFGWSSSSSYEKSPESMLFNRSCSVLFCMFLYCLNFICRFHCCLYAV